MKTGQTELQRQKFPDNSFRARNTGHPINSNLIWVHEFTQFWPLQENYLLGRKDTLQVAKNFAWWIRNSLIPFFRQVHSNNNSNAPCSKPGPLPEFTCFLLNSMRSNQTLMESSSSGNERAGFSSYQIARISPTKVELQSPLRTNTTCTWFGITIAI